MGAGHDHHHDARAIRHERPLWIAFGLTTAFLVAEVIGALWTGSLALLSDAAHMGTDVLALGISLFAVRMARRPADARRTYGYARMEAIGALANGMLLFLLAGYILWEAIGRIRAPQPVATTGMLVVAVLGLLVNLASMRLLRAGAGENLSMKGAYLEVWSDMLGSVAVIAGALLIRATGWQVIDPVIAVLIGLWVLPRTWVLLREAGQVLMQGVPAGIDLDAVRDALQAQSGVRAVHDLHVWALGSREPVLTAHLLLQPSVPDADAVRAAAARMLHERFGIDHATLQLETDPCGATHLHP